MNSRRRTLRRSLAVLVVPVLLLGCAFVPVKNLRLEEAKAAHAELTAIPDSRRLAPRELREASEALQRAIEAWETLQDSALVDHLAYLAKQRAAIARAVVMQYRMTD